MSGWQNSKLPFLILLPLLLGGALAYFILSPNPKSEEPLPVLGTLPDFVLTDQDGNELGLQQLLGKTWVASFIFTRCQATCPRQTKNMAALQDRLNSSPHRNTLRLVSISVDPEHDTPEVLRAYADQHGAATDFWYFLTGTTDEALWLSHDGFKLAAARPNKADGDAAGPMHSSHFALIDPWGQIRGYYDGTSAAAMKDLDRDLKKVVGDQKPTAIPSALAAARRDPSQEIPEYLKDVVWLKTRQRDQLKEAQTWKVFHDFQFSDRLYASGITFRNRVVDDSANRYKPVHYDHGTGIAVADVDGDGLYDIYFVNQVGSSELWRNLGGGRFENITQRAGVGLDGLIQVTATFADVNNDGFPDLYVTTVRGGNHLFLNDGKGNFTDVTEKSGLGLVGHYSSAVFFDYDRDGQLDLFLCEVGRYTTDTVLPVTTPTHGHDSTGKKTYEYFEGFEDAFAGHLHPERFGKCLLLRNTGGGRFVDVTDSVGLGYTGWSGDATPIDLKGDGWPGLYVLNMQGHNEYFENQGGRFIRKSREVFPKTSWGAMGVKVIDYNNDGKFDLIVTDMHSDMSAAVPPIKAAEKRKSKIAWPESFVATAGASIFGNTVFQNQGDGAFKEVSDEVGLENYWPWGLSVGDLNADGFQDVFITAGMSHPFRYAINSLLLNDGGKRFLDSEFVLGVEPRRGWRTATPWFQLNDAAANQNAAPAKITVWGSLSSRSSVVFDLDDDGDLDIVTNEFNGAPLVLLSNLSERKAIRYLKVKLVGSMTPDTKPVVPPAAGPTLETRSNRDGLGAVVRVSCGPNTYNQVNDGKSGYLSQSSLPLYFGLGDAEIVDKVDVTWPSGRKQTVAGPIKANQLIVVQEK